MRMTMCSIKIVDEEEKEFKGDYFIPPLHWLEGCVMATGVRTLLCPSTKSNGLEAICNGEHPGPISVFETL